MNHYDENGLIICQICGNPYHFITPKHLKKQHEMTTKEYREMYPDVPMAKKGYYNTLKEKKESRKIADVETSIEPVIEELNLNESFDCDDAVFKECESIVKLADRKVPVPEKSVDPMDDKINIIRYLKLSFPGIKNNYMFKKKAPNGNIEYQFITDMADPYLKIVFDFPNSFWHNEQTGVSSNVRNQMLKSYGWKIIEVKSSMPKVSHVESKLKDK